MIDTVKGNLLDAPENVIAHGVNCMGAFGAGVAKAIRNKWIEAYHAYILKYNDEGWKLGDIQIVPLKGHNNKFIANLATQQGYGYHTNQRVYVDYDALSSCLLKLFQFCHEENYSIAIPKIGAGLAGGDWNKIQYLISCADAKYPVKIHLYIL